MYPLERRHSATLASRPIEPQIGRERLEILLRECLLPRLAAMHADKPRRPPPVSPDAEDVKTLALLSVRPGCEDAVRFVRAHAARGGGFEALAENLIVAAARSLGEEWIADRCDFLDVTFGVGQLQECLKAISNRAPGPSVRPRRALLISLPGDAHVFGLDVIGAFLAREGWDVVFHRGHALDFNLRQVEREWVHVVGVTMGGVKYLAPLTRALRGLRRASCNPGLKSIVGGVSFARDPELAVRAGADGLATDGPSAAALAAKLWRAQEAAAA